MINVNIITCLVIKSQILIQFVLLNTCCNSTYQAKISKHKIILSYILKLIRSSKLLRKLRWLLLQKGINLIKYT